MKRTITKQDRVEQVRRMLMAGMSIKDIRYETGWSSIHALARKTGLEPRYITTNEYNYLMSKRRTTL